MHRRSVHLWNHLATYRATGSATPTTTEFMPLAIGSISYGGDNRQIGPRRPGRPRANMSAFTRERKTYPIDGRRLTGRGVEA
jgi:hypothetical protein